MTISSYWIGALILFNASANYISQFKEFMICFILITFLLYLEKFYFKT